MIRHLIHKKSVRLLVIALTVLSACVTKPVTTPPLAEAPPTSPDETGVLPMDRFKLVALLGDFANGSMSVAGQPVVANENTQSSPDLTPGQMVSVEGIVQPDGTLLATEINPADASTQASFEWTGVVRRISETELVIGGLTFVLAAEIEVRPDIEDGAIVHVEGVIGPNNILTITAISLVSTGDSGNANDQAQDDQDDKEDEDEDQESAGESEDDENGVDDKEDQDEDQEDEEENEDDENGEQGKEGAIMMWMAPVS